MKRKKVKIEDQSSAKPLIFSMILAKCKAILTVGLIFKPCRYFNHQVGPSSVQVHLACSLDLNLQGFQLKGIGVFFCLFFVFMDFISYLNI